MYSWWCSGILTPLGAHVKSPESSVRQSRSIATEFGFVAAAQSITEFNGFIASLILVFTNPSKPF